MRRVKIDFLAPEPTRGRDVRWLRAGLWLTGVAFVAWEINLARQLLAENETLNAAAAGTAIVSAGDHNSGLRQSGPARTSGLTPWFDREFLAGAERAFTRVPQSGAELRLDSLVLDANRRLLVVRGNSAGPRAVDRLATELRAEFPQASAGFPNVQSAADRSQFEISLQFPAPGAAR